MICSTKENETDKYSVFREVLPSPATRSSVDGLTCETCCDSAAVDGAVAGAGLVHHLIKR